MRDKNDLSLDEALKPLSGPQDPFDIPILGLQYRPESSKPEEAAKDLTLNFRGNDYNAIKDALRDVLPGPFFSFMIGKLENELRDTTDYEHVSLTLKLISMGLELYEVNQKNPAALREYYVRLPLVVERLVLLSQLGGEARCDFIANFKLLFKEYARMYLIFPKDIKEEAISEIQQMIRLS